MPLDAPAPNVLIGDVTVGEADGTASFAISLSHPSSDDVTLTLTTADGSAEAGQDYTATTGQVTILAGQTDATGTFDVPVTNDNVDEAAKSSIFEKLDIRTRYS